MKICKPRTRLAVCLVALVLLAGLIGACSEPAATPSPAPAPAPSPSPAPAPAPAPAPSPAPAPPPAPAPAPTPEPTPEEVIELVIHCPNPPTAVPGMLMDEFANKFEEASGGRVHFTRYFAQSLFEPRENIQSVLAGLADIHVSAAVQAEPDALVLNNFIMIPCIGWQDAETASKIVAELYNTIPELNAEWQGCKVLYPTVWGVDSWLSNSKRPVATTADIAGLKLQVDSYHSPWVETLGATPVYLAFADRFTAFEKGVVDGTISSFGPLIALGALDLFQYHTYVPNAYATGFYTTIMNPDSYNALPPDIQKIFEDLRPWFMQRPIDLEGATNVQAVADLKAAGHTFVEVSPETAQEWLDAALPDHQKWISDTEAKGKPGQMLYDELQRLLAEYK